jgi:hypothetical protein
MFTSPLTLALFPKRSRVYLSPRWRRFQQAMPEIKKGYFFDLELVKTMCNPLTG